MHLEKTDFHSVKSFTTQGGAFDVVSDSYTFEIDGCEMKDFVNLYDGGAAFYIKYSESTDVDRKFEVKDTTFTNITGIPTVEEPYSIFFITQSDVEVNELTLGDDSVSGYNDELATFMVCKKCDFRSKEVKVSKFQNSYNGVLLYQIEDSKVNLEDIQVHDCDLKESEVISIKDCEEVDLTDIKFTMVNSTSTKSLLYMEGSTFTFEDSTFDWNSCGTCEGSAFQIKTSSGHVKNLKITNSYAWNGGGACFVDPGTDGIEFTDSDFVSDVAQNDGGGMYVRITHDEGFDFKIDGLLFKTCKAVDGKGGAMSLQKDGDDDAETRRVLDSDEVSISFQMNDSSFQTDTNFEQFKKFITIEGLNVAGNTAGIGGANLHVQGMATNLGASAIPNSLFD